MKYVVALECKYHNTCCFRYISGRALAANPVNEVHEEDAGELNFPTGLACDTFSCYNFYFQVL